MNVCTICSGDFDLEKEGGSEGFIGILPVSFCPTCKVGIMEFAELHSPPIECCGEC
jgi:hypothetical protein